MDPKRSDVQSRPELIDPTAFVAPSATIVGQVSIAADCSVMHGAVLRGDVEEISVGEGSNVQDLCCLHADPGHPCRLGRGVTVGHRAVVHGATIEDDVLIGIGAIVLNGVRIGRHSIIAAGTVVPERMQVPACSMVMGVPGKIVRETTPDDVAMIERAAAAYVRLNRVYRGE